MSSSVLAIRLSALVCRGLGFLWESLPIGLRQPSDRLPNVFVVVEGQYDIEFLRRISPILHTRFPTLPDLTDLERQRQLVFVPAGGGDSLPWAVRFAGMTRHEFHLLDRDVSPVTQTRQRVIDLVNSRPGCLAVLTRMRSLENYLHSEAVFEAIGVRVEFSADDNVADLISRIRYEQHPEHLPWDSLSLRTRKRHRDKIKRLLNTVAVARMTPERLAQQDPHGEVQSWLETIAKLAKGGL